MPRRLKKVADESGALFILTHNYTGYPMVRQAREMIANGELGDIRIVQAEYPQDWLTRSLSSRPVPSRPSGAPIRRSRAQVVRPAISARMPIISPAFITGLELDSLAADLDSFVEGRRLDDNAHVLLRFKAKGKEKPAKGMLWCSQVAPGHENGLKIRVYGTKGGFEWTQADPNYLVVHAVRRAEAADYPQRRRVPVPPLPASHAFRPAIRKVISKPSRRSTRKRRMRSMRTRMAKRSPRPWSIRPSMTA